MLSPNKKSDYATYNLQIGYLYFTEVPTIIGTILGSCVSVCIFDSKNKWAGMNHYLMPVNKDGQKSTKYGNVSIFELYRLMIKAGTKKEDMIVRIVGGSSKMQTRESVNIALDNIKVAEEFFKKRGIAVLSKNVGGEDGRKIYYNTYNNKIKISKLSSMECKICDDLKCKAVDHKGGNEWERLMF